MGPKGWMDGNMFLQWVQELRAIDKDLAGKTCVVLMENWSDHYEVPEHLEACADIIVKIWILPANITHMYQTLFS